MVGENDGTGDITSFYIVCDIFDAAFVKLSCKRICPKSPFIEY